MPVPQEYQDKFGCSANDWPCVAANLEGIIDSLTHSARTMTADDAAQLEAFHAIQDTLKVHCSYGDWDRNISR